MAKLLRRYFNKKNSNATDANTELIEKVKDLIGEIQGNMKGNEYKVCRIYDTCRLH